METEQQRVVVWAFGAAFLVLGLLIGTLLAMSAQSIVQAVIAALFAMFGGSILVLLEKVSPTNQLKSCVAILAVSLGTLVGVYSGVYVNEHELLTPTSRRVSAFESRRMDTEVEKYLKAYVRPKAAAIDEQYTNKMIKAEEAYDRLRKVVGSN